MFHIGKLRIGVKYEDIGIGSTHKTVHLMIKLNNLAHNIKKIGLVRNMFAKTLSLTGLQFSCVCVAIIYHTPQVL